MIARLLALLCALTLSLVGSAGLAQPEFPERGTAPVLDLANVIDDTDEALLTQRLDAFEQANQRQFVVVTVPSLDGYEISDYGYQLGRHWGLGDDENDDGIILLVAPNERRVRIEVGYGLESVIPDGLAHDIVEREIVPRFKEGDMTGGIVAGADAIVRHLELPPEEQQAAIAQAAQRGVVVGEMRGLAPHGCFPAQAQPRQVLADRVCEFRAAARAVDVLNPQQHDTVMRPRMIMRQQRRISVAEVQPARRRGRESRDDIFHESRIIRSTRFPDAKPETTFAGKRS